MPIHPVKKLCMDQQEEKEEENPLLGAETLPEILEIACIQEIEAKHLSIIETLILAIQNKETQKIWMYGEKKVQDHILAIVSNTVGMRLEPLRKKSEYNVKNIYVLDLSSINTIIARGVLYKTLEKVSPIDILGNKFIFQLTSIADVNKLEKRIISRCEGIKVYAQGFKEKDYLTIFSRALELMKARAREASSTSMNTSVNAETDPSTDADTDTGIDFKYVEENLMEFIRTAYLVDTGCDFMFEKFYRFLYRIEDYSPYSLLNSVHLIILLFSTIKRTTLSSVYEEFKRRTSVLAHFKRVDRNIVYRRLTDLTELGMIARGFFIHDRLELEEEVNRRKEVYLRVMLEQIKKHWT
ncbi:hypothetical protein NECID01_0947 [Nematocida sp. AWRm77]|nr:hypothetical protein NECID01_0947 [Nematocida sp. AWRm77]